VSAGLLDTGPLDTEPRDATSARRALPPREAWRRARLPLLLGALIVAVAVLRAIATGGVTAGRMDPDAAAPEGGRALATLLRQHGVDVRTVDVPSGSDGVTVFVPVPRLANAARPEALALASSASEVVVAEARDPHLAALGVEADQTSQEEERTVDPGCSQPDAVAAGDARLGGLVYEPPPGAAACYAVRGGASFVEVATGGRRVTVVGTASFMTNEYLGEDGNAALALRLLTRHPTVEWVYPREVPAAPDDGEQSVLDLLPDRIWLFTFQAFVAVLLLALWRARRLGPVVVEPLPVVVRAAEAVEGRARLYEAAGARDRAAAALRAGLRDRLVRALGLARDAGRETLVAAVSARSGLDGPAVDDLLYGPPPADDEGLVRLADGLDSLDAEVRAL
jgi:hypothetical protein